MATPFKTEFTADPSQYNAAMDEIAQKSLTTSQRIQSQWREAFNGVNENSTNSVKQTINSFNAHFDGVKKAVTSLRGVIGAAGTAMAGALFVKKLADDSSKATLETEKLAQILGVTTQEASALKVALSDIGVETDTYVSATSKLVINLRENEERLNQLGVVTRDQNRNLVNTEELVRNAGSALLEFKEGTDRNLASTEMFGKSWTEVNRIMRLTPAAMEEARQKAIALQTEVGPEGVARAEQYRRAMGDVRDMISAMANRIGQALMPALTDLGNWFSSAGPDAVFVMRGAIGGLVSVWHGLVMAVQIVWEVIKAFFAWVGVAVGVTVGVFSKLIRLDFAGAKAAWKVGFDQMGDVLTESLDNAIEKAKKTRKRLADLFLPSEEQGGSAASSGGGKLFSPEIKGSRVSQWDAELAAARDAYDRMQLEQGSFQQFSRERERDYWKHILDTVRMNKEEMAAVSRKYYDAERDIRKASFEAEIAEIKAQIEVHKRSAAERVDLVRQIEQKIRERFGDQSKEAKDALRDRIAAEREAADEARKLQEIELDSFRSYQLSRVELERANLEFMQSVGLITAEEKLARLRQLKEIEFQIELKSAEERAALLQGDVVAHRQAMERIEEIKRKHTVDMRNQDTAAAEENKKSISKWLDPIGDAVQTMINGVLQGTQKMSDVMRNMLRGILNQYIATLVKMGLEWVKMEILKSQATVAGAAVRTTAEAGAATASSGFAIGSAISTIGAKAWEAAASVYAAVADIPFVGWILAPIMALAAAGTVLGFISRIASAAGGFDVPKGINPMTQLHGGEMVLPETLADKIRGMTDSGGSGGGVHAHFHGAVFDARGMERLFRNNPGIIESALRKIDKNARS